MSCFTNSGTLNARASGDTLCWSDVELPKEPSEVRKEQGGKAYVCDPDWYACSGSSVCDDGKAFPNGGGQGFVRIGAIYRENGPGDPLLSMCYRFTYDSDGSEQAAHRSEGKNSGPPCKEKCALNPVNVGNGNNYERETDYVGAGPFPLRFDRHYNSILGTRSRRDGWRWKHTYERAVFEDGTSVVVTRETGRAVYFEELAGVWVGDPDAPETLERLIDGGGQPIGWKFTDENDAVEIYDVDGLLLSITTRMGFTQSLTYNASNQLTQVTGPFGRSLTLTYDVDGQWDSMTDPAGNVFLYAYNANGNLVSVSYPDETSGDPTDNPTRQYHYDDLENPDALTGITNEHGVVFVTWTYDVDGRVIANSHASGANSGTISYDEVAGTSTLTDALGAARTYTFNTLHGQIHIATVSGAPCTTGCGSQFASYTQDANGYPASRTDHNGNVTTFVHDGRGLEVSRTEANGTPEERTITTQWHPTFRIPTLITAPGKTTAFTYDAEGRLLTRTETDTVTGSTRTVTNSYNAQGLLATRDGPRTDVSDVTTFAYDAQGQLINTTNALGHVSQVTAYDAHGRPLTLQDPNGLVTTLAYDARNRLVSRDVGGQLTTFEYDGVGNVTKTTLPDGSFLVSEYDDAQRLVAIEDNLGNRTEFTLDAAGNRISETIRDPSAVITRTRTRIFNILNRLTQDVGGAGQTIDFEYDLKGNQTGVIVDVTGLNQYTTSEYDALHRLAKSIDPDLGETGFGYDARDNLISVTDAESLTTTFTYDGLENLTAQSSPDTGLTLFTYDDAGNRLSQTDARGVVTGFTYDALNRLVSIAYPDTTKNVDFEYDQGSNGIGRLTRMTDESGSTDFSYDIRGNLLSETRSIDSVAYVTAYTYDSANRVLSVTYPSGTMGTYTRDSLGRVVSVDVVQGTTTRSVLSGIDYLPFGPIKGFTYGNGISVTRTFDPDYRLTAQTAGSVQDFSLGYDDANNITGITDGLDLFRSQTFYYDALNQLTTAQSIYGTKDYSYDAIGNRLTLFDAAGFDVYDYSPNSHQLSAITGPSATTFAYDAAGNTIAKGPQSFVYDDTNRMTEASVSGIVVGGYVYNGKGERVKKTAGGVRTVFHYDAGGRLIAESATDGTTTKEYVYLDGQLVAILAPEQGAPEPAAEITNPTPGSTLTSDPVTFSWTSVAGATQYELKIGYSVGADEIATMNVGTTTTSATVSGIPLAGGTIHVQLGTDFGTHWAYRNYTYETAALVGPAEIDDPTPGSTLASDPVTFSWASVAGAIQYQLSVGYSQGTSEIESVSVDGATTSATVNGIPLAGGTIHVQLATNFGTHTDYRQYTYQTSDLLEPAEMIDPVPGSTLDNETVTFNWGAVTGALQYALKVGTIASGQEIYPLEVVSASTTSITVSTIPLSGDTMHVELGTDFGSGFEYRAYTYATADLVEFLQVRVMDTGQYGHDYGPSQHFTELEAVFIGTATNLTFQVTGYDIDFTNELALYLNGNLLGYLTVGPNNGLNAGDAFPIPVTSQLPGLNRLRFKQKTAGWIWGVTNLLVTDQVPLVITTTTISNASYGSNYAETLIATGGTGTHTWSLTTGTLPSGLALANDGSLTGTPTEQGTFNFTARVTDDLGIYDEQAYTLLSVGESGTVEVILQVGVMDTGQYGHNYGSSEHYTDLYAIFANAGTDLTFQVTGYDIDFTDELALYLNGNLLGYLTVGPNNGLNAGDAFTIPAASQIPGLNQLWFKQKTAGWKWGVTNLLLTP